MLKYIFKGSLCATNEQFSPIVDKTVNFNQQLKINEGMVSVASELSVERFQKNGTFNFKEEERQKNKSNIVSERFCSHQEKLESD